jgi:hypothetical protein
VAFKIGFFLSFLLSDPRQIVSQLAAAAVAGAAAALPAAGAPVRWGAPASCAAFHPWERRERRKEKREQTRPCFNLARLLLKRKLLWRELK